MEERVIAYFLEGGVGNAEYSKIEYISIKVLIGQMRLNDLEVSGLEV